MEPLFVPPSISNRCKLIKLKRNSKEPDQPSWSVENSFFPNDVEIIEHVGDGNNYGIIPINNTIVIDCDTDKLYNVIPEDWKNTLTVITGRSGNIGRHLLFDCPNSLAEKTTIKDPEDPKIQLGDIRGSDSNTYTVGAGSIHPDTGRKYKYENPDAPLVTVKWEEIKTNILDKFKIKIKESIPQKTRESKQDPLTSLLNLRIENFALPAGKTKQHVNGDLQGAHPIHGSTTGMNFAINRNKNVFHCYRCDVGGDPISWIAYSKCNVPEEDCNNLSDEQFKDVVQWLRNNGYADELNKIDSKYISNSSEEILKDAIEDITKQKPKIKEESVATTAEEKNNLIQIEIDAARKRCDLPPFPEMENGLFKDYMDFGKRVSYSLHEFHFAALLSIVSMTIGRSVLIQVGMTKVYTNVFAMVVGHTTISGKSVACNMAIDKFASAIIFEQEFNKTESTNLLRGTISEPALIQSLNDTYNSLWYYDDCAGFFEDAAGWNAHVLGTLCSLYDGTPIVRTLSKRGKANESYKWECPTPFVSILFNTTNKDIEQVSSARLFSSGFFPRLMWFYGQGGQPRKNENVSKEDSDILSEIYYNISDLRVALENLDNDSIVFGVCDEIEEWKLKSTMDKLDKEDEAYRTAISRGFIHVYKIAAILSMVDKDFQKTVLKEDKLEYPIKVEIPSKHAQTAIKIVERYLVPRMMYVYDLCNNSDNKNHQVMVMKALTQMGGACERTKLLRKTHLNSKDMNIALTTMIESKEIKMFEQTKPGNDKPTMFVLKLD
jgi:hypothetical protein